MDAEGTEKELCVLCCLLLMVFSRICVNPPARFEPACMLFRSQAAGNSDAAGRVAAPFAANQLKCLSINHLHRAAGHMQSNPIKAGKGKSSYCRLDFHCLFWLAAAYAVSARIWTSCF
jgi:hypothetical protein